MIPAGHYADDWMGCPHPDPDCDCVSASDDQCPNCREEGHNEENCPACDDCGGEGGSLSLLPLPNGTWTECPACGGSGEKDRTEEIARG